MKTSQATEKATKFARHSGWFFLILGLISLLPTFVGPGHELPDLRLNLSYGKFLGYLPLNLLSKLVLIGFGIGGLVIAHRKDMTEDACIDYSRIVFYTMGTLASFSWFRDTNSLFGYMPLFNGAGLFFGLLSLLGFYYGYITQRARLHDKDLRTHSV